MYLKLDLVPVFLTQNKASNAVKLSEKNVVSFVISSKMRTTYNMREKKLTNTERNFTQAVDLQKHKLALAKVLAEAKVRLMVQVQMEDREVLLLNKAWVANNLMEAGHKEKLITLIVEHNKRLWEVDLWDLWDIREAYR
jgi:hypothetical protein